MNSRLPNITRVSFLKINDVQGFITDLQGNVHVSGSWTDLPLVTGTSDCEIKEKRPKGNLVFEIELAIRTKQTVVNPGPVLIKLEFETDPSLIIGMPDYPVRLLIDRDLRRKQLSFQYTSLHFPLTLQ